MPTTYGYRHLTRLQQCSRHSHSTSTSSIRAIPVLPNATLPTFRKEAFEAAIPALLPRQHFLSLPAREKWFQQISETQTSISLNKSYLSQYGDAPVPLELTSNGAFTQIEQPLSFFLEATTSNHTASVYLAQASLSDLPAGLRADVPTPELVLRAGKGDVYSTSIWLGQAPTYTPLHRDPNPNLFVQLAGSKRVRLFAPDLGTAIFHHVQQVVGGRASASMRGVEMMQGEERRVLEDAVWGDADADDEAGQQERFWESEGWECEVGAGDALFIPKGWWHSIKGIGRGMTGSVNWWFR